MAQRMGGATHVGQRQRNEDSYCLFDLVLSRDSHQLLAVLAVADGMGGHVDGAVASKVAIRHVERFVSEGIDVDHLDQLMPRANDEIRIHASTLGERVGTTLTVAIVEPGVAHVLHIGDSRAYLVGNSSIAQVTDDHSLVGELLRDGAISEQEAMHHDQSNVLHRALGVADVVDPDVYRVGIGPGDALLLCSDGLTAVVTPEDMLSVLRMRSSMEEAASELVSLAVARGGDDNITVVIWRYPGGVSEVRQTIVSPVQRQRPLLPLERSLQALVVLAVALITLLFGYQLGSLL